MTDIKDVAWLAGLLEGEGCFGIYANGAGSLNPQVALWMCDEDVVARATRIGNELVGGGTNSMYRRKEVQANPAWKPQFGYVWSGKRALNLMWSLVPYLGERRTAKCVDVVSEWYESRYGECIQCGGRFWAETKSSKLCSDPCKAAAHKDAVRRFQAKQGKL